MRHSCKLAGVVFGAALMTACGSSGLSSSPSPLAAENQQGASRGSESPLGQPKLTILHSFAGPDGWSPDAPVTNVDGVIYGTAREGGDTRCREHSQEKNGCGVVFKYTGTGIETVLLLGGLYGWAPRAGLINVNGTLYGVAEAGGEHINGVHGNGTVFAITYAGAQVIHKFQRADGVHPQAPLVDVDGTLYGTTNEGGVYGRGTLFKIANVASGPEFSVVHSFGQGRSGTSPQTSLIDVHGTLYGTTISGGSNDLGSVFAFKIRTGEYHTVYSFEGGSDGANPIAGLIYLDGAFYGTTLQGGQSSNICCGTIYWVTPNGKERVLYRFQQGTTGFRPRADLVNVTDAGKRFDKVYGTARSGGKYGCGTIFSFDPVGAPNYAVVHDFACMPNDGADPISALIDVRGTLFGTTQFGGENNGGTLFKLKL